MQGVPEVPIDGEQYAALAAGYPSVLEYDGPTGGYKLVVATEAGVAINVSGTVEVTGGQIGVVGAAVYGEDTPHASGQTGTFIMGVRRDAAVSQVDTEGDYAGLIVDGLGRLHVAITGAYVDTELPAPDVLTTGWSADPDPSLPAIYGVNLAYHLTSGNLVRLEAHNAAYPATAGIDFQQSLQAQAISLGRIDGGNTYQPHALTALGDLRVTMVSGSMPAAGMVADTELPAAKSLNLWAIEPFTPTTDLPAIATYPLGYDLSSDNFHRLAVFSPSYPVQLGVDFQNLQMVQGISLAENAAGTYEPLEASTLGDAVSNPNNALEVGAYLMGIDRSGGDWARIDAVDMRSIGGLQQPDMTDWSWGFQVIGGLYGQHPTIDARLQLIDADTERRLSTRAFVTGTVDTELSVATALSDALGNPTAGGVGAYLLGYDNDAGQWRRANVVDASVIQLDGNDDMPRILGTAAHLYGRNYQNIVSEAVGVTALHSNLMVSLVSGSFPGQPGGGQGLLDGITSATRAGLVGSMGYGYNAASDVWDRLRIDPSGGGLLVSITGSASVDTELPAAASLSDTFGNPTAPAVGAFLMGYDRENGDWTRMDAQQHGENYNGNRGFLVQGQNPEGLNIYDISVDIQGRQYTTMVSGSYPHSNMQSAVVNISGTSSSLVAAVPGQSINVVGYQLISDAAQQIHFYGGTGSLLTGPMNMAGDTQLRNSTPHPGEPLFATAPSEGLSVGRNSAVALLGGYINYYLD